MINALVEFITVMGGEKRNQCSYHGQSLGHRGVWAGSWKKDKYKENDSPKSRMVSKILGNFG